MGTDGYRYTRVQVGSCDHCRSDRQMMVPPPRKHGSQSYVILVLSTKLLPIRLALATLPGSEQLCTCWPVDCQKGKAGESVSCLNSSALSGIILVAPFYQPTAKLLSALLFSDDTIFFLLYFIRSIPVAKMMASKIIITSNLKFLRSKSLQNGNHYANLSCENEMCLNC